MKYVCIIVLLFIGLTAHAQNLVPNHSFEQYLVCPPDVSSLTGFCKDWRAYTAGTTDYFNSCHTGAAGVPKNILGTETPSGGQAYTGLYAYHKFDSVDYREYLAAEIPSLIPGNFYEFSMYVSLADYAGQGSDNLGVSFYQGAPATLTTSGPLPVTPQITFKGYGPIVNKNGWLKVRGVFQADMAFNNLVIGGFGPSVAVKHKPSPIPPGAPQQHPNSSYYYIDALELRIADTLFVTFDDTVVCATDTIEVPYGVFNPGFSFVPGNVFQLQLSDANGSFVNPVDIGSVVSTGAGIIKAVIPANTAPGTAYRLRVKSSNRPMTSADNGRDIAIGLYLPIVAGSNAPICQNSDLMLAAQPGSPHATWNWIGPGFSSTDQSPTIKNFHGFNGHMYIVTSDVYGCITKDTVIVKVKPVPEVRATSNRPDCAGDTLYLNASANMPLADFSWSGPSGFVAQGANPVVKTRRGYSGTYYVQATVDGCTSEPDSLQLLMKEIPDPIVADTTVCQYSSPVPLFAKGDSLRWYLDSNETTGSLQQPSYQTTVKGKRVFYVTQTQQGCESEKKPLHIAIIGTPEIDLGSDSQICSKHSIELGTEMPGTSYHWNTGHTNCCIAAAPGIYVLSATNKCGTTTDSIKLSAKGCDSCLFVPTAFTPNNDGKNDTWGAFKKCGVKDYRLSVFDRWGNMVFHSISLEHRWNGYYRGVPSELGTYFYIIKYTPDSDWQKEDEVVLAGDITLVR